MKRQSASRRRPHSASPDGHVSAGTPATLLLPPERLSARILLVEDQDDVRQMLATALRIEGHEVDEAATAVGGLRQLEQARYNLVLSDYAMPGGTGAWMLNEAAGRGLLDGTAALLVTAHPDVGDVGVEVITKPLDLDSFLEQVRRILMTSAARPQRAPQRRARRARHRVELVLYISSSSPASLQARRNLERILEGFVASQVKYTLCDLVREPFAGDGDRVAFTPTLVKRYPEPRTWVVGSLRDWQIVADLLRVSGVDAKA